jgi:hypothetical protein
VAVVGELRFYQLPLRRPDWLYRSRRWYNTLWIRYLDRPPGGGDWFESLPNHLLEFRALCR